MVYQWKTGFRSVVSANTVGSVCEKLSKNGNLTAEHLVDYSRSEESETHALFEWDNDRAAEKWRMQQARVIIGSLTVKVENSSESGQCDPVKVRAFHIIEEDFGKRYESLNVIMSDSKKTDYVLGLALKELTSFRDKYKNLQQLLPLMKEIDKTIEENGGKKNAS